MSSARTSLAATPPAAPPRSIAPRTPDERWVRLLPHVATAVVLGMGAYAALTRPGLWMDEAWSLSIAHRPLGGVVDVIVGRERNMALFFLLLHAWAAVSDHLLWLVALPLVFAVACVPAVTWVGRLLGGRRAGALAAVLLAGNVGFLAYAVELRGYTLAVLLALLTVGSFVTALRTAAPGWLATFAVLALLLTATTVLSPLLLLALGLTAVLRPQGRRPAVLAVLAGLAVVVGALAFAVLATDQGNVDWIPATSLPGLAAAALALAGGPVGLLVSAVCTSALTVAVLRHRRPGDVLVLAWLVVPVVGLLLFSLAKPLLVPRYLLFVVPALALAGAIVLSRRRAGLLVAVAAAVAVAVTGAATPWTARENDVTAAAAFVLDRDRPGDALAYQPAAARAFFGDALGSWASDAPRPRDLALAAGGSPWDRGDTYGAEVGAAEVVRRAAAVERLWVVEVTGWEATTGEGSFTDVDEVVLAGREVLARRTFGNTVVSLYALPG